MLEIQLSHTEDVDTRVERIRRLGELTETSLKDKATAYAWGSARECPGQSIVSADDMLPES